jgi:hypothetical protein
MLLVACACGRTELPSLGINTPIVDEDTPVTDTDEPFVPQPDIMALLPSRNANLIGYWHFEENFEDAGPRNNDLAVHFAAPTIVQGGNVGSGYAEFYDESLDLSNRPSIEVGELSYSLWFYSDLISTPNSNSGHTFFKYTCPTCGDPNFERSTAWGVQAQNDGRIRFPMDNVGVAGAPAGTVIADEWHHVAGVFTNTREAIYVDGVIAYDGPNRGPLFTENAILMVGQLWPNVDPLYNPQFLHGGMEELAIWGTVLTDAELLAIWENQRP